MQNNIFCWRGAECDRDSVVLQKIMEAANVAKYHDLLRAAEMDEIREVAKTSKLVVVTCKQS